jgi:hypothetical protein
VELYVVFLLGAVGALAPEILRLYALRTDRAAFQWSGFYLLISLLFAALGGVVALVLPATTPYAAFYAGVSAPTVVNTALKKALGGDEKKSNGNRGPLPPSLKTFVSAL